MKRILVMYLVISPLAFAQSMRTLSIEDAIKVGLQQSKKLRASSMRMEAASARASEVRTALLPSLKLESSYKRLSEVDPFEVNLPFSPTPVTLSPIVLDNYNVKLALRHPLFTGFKLKSNARVAEYLARVTEFEYRSDEADLILDIKNAYWTLYQTFEVKKYVDENVARLETHLQDTNNLLKAGSVTRNDLLKIQVELSNGRLTQIDASNNVQVAAMNLNNILGQPLDMKLKLASKPSYAVRIEDLTHSNFPISDHRDKLSWARRAGLRDWQDGLPAQRREKIASMQQGIPSISNLVRKALESRAELRSMEFRVEAEEASVAAARASWWPQIFLSGNYYYNRPNYRLQPTRDEFEGTWEFGVQLQFDIWNWGATVHQTEQARAQLRQTEYLYDQMKDDVSLEVARYHLQVQRNREKIVVAQLAINQAEENSRSTSNKYKNGLATSSNLLDADVALLQARTNLTGALVEYELAKARLERAIGYEQ